MAQLYLFGGGDSDNIVKRLCKRFRKKHGRDWTVPEKAKRIAALLKFRCAVRHKRLETYRPAAPIPDYMQRLIVEKKAHGYQIRDGYHRAVVMWNHQRLTEAVCYIGPPSPKKHRGKAQP